MRVTNLSNALPCSHRQASLMIVVQRPIKRPIHAIVAFSENSGQLIEVLAALNVN